METGPDAATIKGWFTGRLPEGWFTSTEVSMDGEHVLVVGKLPDVQLGSEASAEEKKGAAEGRIARFREQTRGERIQIAQEVESRFGKYVTWGASCGEVTKEFTKGGSGRGGGDAEEHRRVMIAHRARMLRWWLRNYGPRHWGPGAADPRLWRRRDHDRPHGPTGGHQVF